MLEPELLSQKDFYAIKILKVHSPVWSAFVIHNLADNYGALKLPMESSHLNMDSLVSLINHDASDLRSWILIWIGTSQVNTPLNGYWLKQSLDI